MGVTVKTTDSVEDVVSVLKKHSILSAPVLDETSSCIGVVDMLDIVRFIVAASPQESELKKDELGSLNVAGRAISLVPIKSVVNASGKDAPVMIFKDSPASMLADLFAKGVHRAILFSKDKEVAHVVSQSDVNRFVSENLKRGALKEIGQKSLKALGYNTVKIETVSTDATVIEALQKMQKQGVSALAVIDTQSGRLVGNFSASDCRGLYKESFPHLLDTVQDFLKTHSPKSLQTIVGVPETSLIDVSAELVEKKLHHMWVVEEFKPTGIISLTDIMRIVVA